LALACLALALGGCGMVRATSLAPRLTEPLSSSGGRSCAVTNQSAEQVFRSARNGVAVVRTDNGLGSAFVVAQQNGRTYLVTNNHVVAGSATAELKWVDGSSDRAAVVARGTGETPTTDLALLAVEGTRGQRLQLSDHPSAVGKEVFVIGAPKGLEFSLSRGVVSSLRDQDGILQIDAAVNPGNSGGPVLDASNCVAGIATFKFKDSEGLNFAVSAATVRSFLNNLPADSEEAASGGASVCVFRSADSGGAERIPCRLRRAQGGNGQTLYDLAWADGSRSLYAFFDDGTVSIRGDDGQGGSFGDQGTFKVDPEGVSILSSRRSMAFIPGLNPVLN
jgi:S1-C subfamily serine protease